MRRWLGRLGTALLIAILATVLTWVFVAIWVWLDSIVSWQFMMGVAAVIFVLTVAVDWFVDAFRVSEERTRARALKDALSRADDEL